MIRSDYPEVDTLHFFSDGPVTQYKQKGNFFYMSTQPFILGFSALSWHFFEASHGKRASDGVGGAIKHKATKLVHLGKDISDARTLHDILLLEKTSLKLFYIECVEVEKNTDYL